MHAHGTSVQFRRRGRRWACLSAIAAGFAAVVSPAFATAQDRGGPPGFGAPLPGLTPQQLAVFNSGKAEFEAVEDVADGLGPVFNCNSCVSCHNGPASGGGSNQFATYFGRRVNGRFDPMIEFGGPNIQAQGIVGLNGYQFKGEVVPKEATIVAKRRATAAFGFGFVDALPDDALRQIAMMQQQQTPRTAGRPNEVKNLRTGMPAVGRFGWKAQGGSLFDFSAGAYKDEMGITTPGFLRDSQGRSISEENAPQGNVSLLVNNPVASPNEKDQSGAQSFADFMSLLAPPPRGPVGREEQRGEQTFATIGCANCHLPALTTGPHPVRALSRQTFYPYSDFLLHDMGSLGDGIEQGTAKGSDMRTAPLWGLRVQPSFLHDGRAKTIEAAIVAHDGQGLPSAQAFQRLNDQKRRELLAFLRSL